MSTLGGRIGYAAAGRVAASLRVSVYYADTCALDGVRVAAACEELHVRNCGRHALVLASGRDGQGVRVELRREALDIAWEYRRLSEALERARHELRPEALADREKELDLVLDGVLQRLRTLPDGDLLEITPTLLDLDTLMEKQP